MSEVWSELALSASTIVCQRPYAPVPCQYRLTIKAGLMSDWLVWPLAYISPISLPYKPIKHLFISALLWYLPGTPSTLCLFHLPSAAYLSCLMLWRALCFHDAQIPDEPWAYMANLNDNTERLASQVAQFPNGDEIDLDCQHIGWGDFGNISVCQVLKCKPEQCLGSDYTPRMFQYWLQLYSVIEFTFLR